ncbi:beta-ketoacyl reductase, partial [Rugosimonospora acidiphila]|uniref:beta-ketoacyl reductase n=1 Tax=Rugosimonospora acidiphila TaxID=556531 RepID=UPI0031E77376
EVESWLSALARLYVTGTPVQWPNSAAPELELPTYPFQHQHYWLTAPGSETSTDTLRYQVDWKPVKLPAATPHGTWVVVAGTGADSQPITEALAACGTTPVVRAAGDEWPASADGVIHLAGTVADLLTTLRETGTAYPDAPVWCLTTGAVGTPGHAPTAPDQAALWGLGRTAGLELPNRWGGLVDVPAGWPAGTGAALAAILAGGHGEDQLAVRDGVVLARKLTRVPRRSSSGWRPRGTVLVTGGTGALGRHTARWLIRNGAERVVLASRSPIDSELETGVETAVCDVTDRAAVQRLVTALGDGLTAVVHAAGVLDDGVIDGLTAERYARVADPKVLGATHLDECTRHLDLDAFVLYSALAGVLGSAGQGNYAAANACLDALAERRRAEGLPATSIAWGPWAGGGMAGSDLLDRLQASGMRALEPARALSCLAGAVDAEQPVAVVADIDWDTFRPAFTATRTSSLLSALAPASAPAATVTAPPTNDLAERLRVLPEVDARRTVLDLVLREVAATLGHADAGLVRPDQAFREAGFTSLAAIELRNRLDAATGLSLSATLVYDFPSPQSLADFVAETLLGSGSGSSSGSGSRDAGTPSGVAVVGDDPVVIVGLGCRFPGGVVSGEGLWDVVAGGVD